MTSNNRFLLILGEFKSDQLFVEKTKLANRLYISNKLCAANNFKNNKRKQLFQILTIY